MEEITSINKILQVLEESKGLGEQEVTQLEKKIKLITDFKDGKPVTKTSILNLICYKNIGYCCGLQKRCIWRDTVLSVFGVTAREYMIAKERCQRELLDDKLVLGHKSNEGKHE